jgi:hypothetical protein
MQTQCTFLSSHKKGLQSSKMGLKQPHPTQGEINLNKQKKLVQIGIKMLHT